MNRAALVRRLKEKGAELGLGAVGVASTVPSHRADFLHRWLAAGHAASMAWMERTAADRIDLRRRFPRVKSAVVATVPYPPYRGDREAQEGLLPHVARYALGRDYHLVLTERLRTLADFLLAEAGGGTARVYVDADPVLERELAARAGLGWIGKHTNLISPGGHSWVLIGVVLTDLELPVDAPVPDGCGSCTACLDACPTGAILEPYLLDAGRCIAYLTIERRGALPRSRRSALGGWVFGCDICQEVCPGNAGAIPVADLSFRPGPHLLGGDLAGLVGLDGTAFHRCWGGSPLARPRRRGLVRNALIVAANTRDEPALAAARVCLADPDPVVRATAAWGLGRACRGQALQDLERAYAREEDPAVREEITAALEGRTGD